MFRVASTVQARTTGIHAHTRTPLAKTGAHANYPSTHDPTRMTCLSSPLCLQRACARPLGRTLAHVNSIIHPCTAISPICLSGSCTAARVHN